MGGRPTVGGTGRIGGVYRGDKSLYRFSAEVGLKQNGAILRICGLKR